MAWVLYALLFLALYSMSYAHAIVSDVDEIRIVTDVVNPDNMEFGHSIANIGDLDGDGIAEIAVGEPGDDVRGQNDTGAVHILFLNGDGQVDRSVEIDGNTGGVLC